MDERRWQVMQWAQGATALNLAFIGVSGGLLAALDALGAAGAGAIAGAAGVDEGYTRRWAEAAYAFGLLDHEGGAFSLTDLGRAFLPDQPGTLMPMAVGAVQGAHMAERAAGLLRSGERPGEVVLAERATIVPWFGPMLEANFGAFFEQQILPAVPAYAEVAEHHGLAVDLGCGNGWYLRRLARRFPTLRGVGLDEQPEHIRQATARAAEEGLAGRLAFRSGDIFNLALDEPADIIAMNRSLHHVWWDRERVMGILRDHLKPGGFAVVWEPRWPDDLQSLRDPPLRAMAFQNLAEHVQGNHFLRPPEVASAFEAAGMSVEIQLFAEGREMIVVARR